MCNCNGTIAIGLSDQLLSGDEDCRNRSRIIHINRVTPTSMDILLEIVSTERVGSKERGEEVVGI